MFYFCLCVSWIYSKSCISPPIFHPMPSHHCYKLFCRSWTQFQRVCGVGRAFLTHQLVIPQMPVGCPTIQLSADTVYLEMASDATGSGPSPGRLPTLPHLRCQFQVPCAATWASDQLVTVRTFPCLPLTQDANHKCRL